MPRFGKEPGPGLGLLGQPPDVVLLSAYSKVPGDVGRVSDFNQQMGHLNRVPVVITQLSIPYPSDIDYIPTAPNPNSNSGDKGGVPMPTIMTIDMSLIETHSPLQYEKFSLSDFKNGTLPGF